MPERTSLAVASQLGVETVPGTSVAASKKLASIGFSLSPAIETNRFRPAGQKYDSLVTLGTEMAEGDIEGSPTYNELQYLLASVLTTPVISVVGVSGQLWTFTPSASSADTPKTLTIEQGDGVRAHKITHGLVTDFTYAFSRTEVTVGGSLIGQQFIDGITLTAGPTALPLIPILPKQHDLFIDTTSAGLGTTKMLRVISGELSIGSRFGPVWTVNSALSSFATTVETEPDATLSLRLQADAAGMALLDTLRAGDTRFIRMRALGGAIAGGTAFHTLEFDMAAKVENLADLGDEDGVYAVSVDFRLVFDATWNNWLIAKLTNTQSAL